MPRQILLAEDHDRNRSLGWACTAWVEHFVRHGPGDVQGQPVRHGEEYTQFLVDCYAVGDAPSNNHLLYDALFVSRPKGTDKSGLAARMCLWEAFGPCRFAGWAKGGEIYRDPWDMGFEYEYQPGEPMGKPVVAPFVRIMATEEGQTGNTYRTVLFNLVNDDCPLFWVPGHDTGKEKVLLRSGGEIRTSTASSSSKDGGLETFVVFDETHLYDLPELKEMKATVARNMRKRKKGAGTLYLETTTMFSPGDESAAEETFKEAESIRSGRKKKGRGRLFYDHRWGVCENLSDEVALRKAIAEAYGDALAWIDIDSIVDEAYDTRSSPAAFRRYFLNAQTSTSDAWIKAHEWEACGRPDVPDFGPGDTIVIGGDGSINDDATAVCGVRVSDGHIQLLGVWQKPDGGEGEGWQVDREAVDACLSNAMRTYNVVGLYFDPPHWSDYLDRWHSEWSEKMKVKATERRPLEWWTSRPTQMVEALERFREAVLEKRLSFTPPEDRTGDLHEMATVLHQHVLHAKRRPSRAGMQIGKAYPGSPDKIDACMAAVIAWTCRNDAVAAGLLSPPKNRPYIARKLR